MLAVVADGNTLLVDSNALLADAVAHRNASLPDVFVADSNTLVPALADGNKLLVDVVAVELVPNQHQILAGARSAGGNCHSRRKRSGS